MKAVVAAFNQEKDLVGAFSVITNLRIELFEALVGSSTSPSHHQSHLILGKLVPGPEESWRGHCGHFALPRVAFIMRKGVD